MKILLSICLSLLFVADLSLAATAQKAAVNEHHAKVLEHTKALKDGAGMTKAKMEEHTKLAGEHLTKAVEAHNAMTGAEKAKPGHAVVARHHTEAMEHHKALTEDVEKASPDQAKVKAHAGKMHDAISKASTHHKTTHK